MNADEIVREARGLHADWVVFESMHHGGGQGAKSDDGEAKRKFMLWLVDDFPVVCDIIESLQAQLADYHHMSELVDGKMEENQRLRRINENLQEQLSASQHREKAARNELCLKCGLYHDAHNGACDGCRWKGKKHEQI